jgi:hypothetical protein
MDQMTHGLFIVVFFVVILRAVGLDSEWLVTFNFVLIYLLTTLVAFSQCDYRVLENYYFRISRRADRVRTRHQHSTYLSCSG